MVEYERINDWLRWDDLIVNRASVANQILGARHDNDMTNPVRVKTLRGERAVYICGALFVKWRMYDETSAMEAYNRMDALSDSLWLLRRGKAISCGDFNQQDCI